MDLHPIYLEVAHTQNAQRCGPGPTQASRNDGAHTHPHAAACELYSSLEPSENGKLRSDGTEKPEGLASIQNFLSKKGREGV